MGKTGLEGMPSPLAAALAAAARLASGPLWLVGGALRDAALGRPLSDLDLAVQGDAEALARALAREVGGSFVTLDDATRVYRVALPVGQIDVAQLQGDSISEDLARRDFALNAMARRVMSRAGRIELGPLLDPRGGLADARARRLRATGPEPFRADPLRMLRAYRLAAQHGLAVVPATARHIRSHAKLVLRCAGERVRAELLGMLGAPDSHRWLRSMDEARLLTALLPELEKARSCARGYYGSGGVLRHTLDAVERMDLLLERLARALPGLEEPVREHLGRWGGAQAPALLRLAVLLHDIAKPKTAKKIAGRLRFFRHDEIGARMAERELERLRFSRREVQGLCACVRHHLRPGNLATNREISLKAIYRFFRDLGEDGVPLLMVCWADHASYLPLPRLKAALGTLTKDPGPLPKDPERGKTVRHLRVVSLLLKSYFTAREVSRPERLLNGNEVMKALGIPPGPVVGKVLGKLSEAQATGKVRDREGAFAYIAKFRRKTA